MPLNDFEFECALGRAVSVKALESLLDLAAEECWPDARWAAIEAEIAKINA